MRVQIARSHIRPIRRWMRQLVVLARGLASAREERAAPYYYYYYFTKPILRVKGGAWRCAGREAHKCALLASSCRPSKPVFGNRLELRLPVSMV